MDWELINIPLPSTCRKTKGENGKPKDEEGKQVQGKITDKIVKEQIRHLTFNSRAAKDEDKVAAANERARKRKEERLSERKAQRQAERLALKEARKLEKANTLIEEPKKKKSKTSNLQRRRAQKTEAQRRNQKKIITKARKKTMKV